VPVKGKKRGTDTASNNTDGAERPYSTLGRRRLAIGETYLAWNPRTTALLCEGGKPVCPMPYDKGNQRLDPHVKHLFDAKTITRDFVGGAVGWGDEKRG